MEGKKPTKESCSLFPKFETATLQWDEDNVKGALHALFYLMLQ